MSCQQQCPVSNLFANCDPRLWESCNSTSSGKLVQHSFSIKHVVDTEIMLVALPPWLPGFVAIFGMHQLAASDAYTP